MKRTLSLLLGLSLLGAASAVAQEAKKDAPKKAAAPAVKLPAQQPDVAAPKFDPKTGQVQAGFAKSHEAFVAVAKKGEAQVVFLGDSITVGMATRPSSRRSMASIRPPTSASVATRSSTSSGASRTASSKASSPRPSCS